MLTDLTEQEMLSAEVSVLSNQLGIVRLRYIVRIMRAAATLANFDLFRYRHQVASTALSRRFFYNTPVEKQNDLLLAVKGVYDNSAVKTLAFSAVVHDFIIGGFVTMDWLHYGTYI